ncbi:hypothetical protein [Paraburkholderia sp. ZP32-5]|uniref:hypothetical protein n=1 Tax=Paraburkholderia sp. ZP32-5 TaxID=2883245 RepID=UPI001F376A02|nr:hypothetical protein [Paraburkholderia sp. ZP32-5]
MKIGCVCGVAIVDQTDYLPHKAHLVADQDWEDFAESSQTLGRIDQTFVRHCYQCVSCGRLYVDDHNRKLVRFIPEAEGARQTLGSIKGTLWKAPLIGAWTSDPPAGKPSGALFCAGTNGVAEQYDTWEELEQAYFELFNRLKGMGLLRSALLRKGGAQIHFWLHSDR